MTVDDRATYAIGAARADSSGTLTAHGSLSRFADQFCVGQPAVAQPVEGEHALGILVKTDGSENGHAGLGGPLIDRARTLPCAGNGDGLFEYWLVAHDMIRVGPQTPRSSRR